MVIAAPLYGVRWQPFTIRRPGAYQEGDALHFVVHAPHHARARLIGEWTDFLANPVPMYSTRDGTYWDLPF